MPENKIQIELQVVVDKFQTSLNQATSSLKSSTDQMTNAVQDMSSKTRASIGSMSEGIKSGFSGIASAINLIKVSVGTLAGLFAIHEIGRIVGNYMAFVKQVHHLSEAFGIATERATTYAIALKEIGLDADTYIMAFKRLVQHVKESPEAFERLGMKIKDSNGAMLPAEEIMQNVIRRLGDFKEGYDRTAAASDAFGIRINNVNEFIQMNEERMAHARETQERLGLTITKDGVNKLFEYQESIADMGLAWTKFAGEVSSIVIPILNTLANAIRSITEAIREFPMDLAKGMAALYGATLPEAAGIFRGIHGREPILPGGEAYVPKPKEVAPGAEISRISEWEAEYRESLLRAMDIQGEFIERNLAEEREFWMRKFAMADLSYKEQEEILRKFTEIALTEWKACHAEEIAGFKRTVEETAKIKELQETQEKATADFLLAQKKEQLDTEVALDRMSKTQELVELRAFEVQAYEIRLKEYEQELDLLRDEPVKYQEMLNKITALKQKQQLEMQRIDKEAAIESQSIWKSILSPITSAINTSINGMIQGTLKLRNALRDLGQAIVAEFINAVIKKMVREWLVGELMKLNISRMFSTILIALGLMTATSQVAIQAGASAATVETKVGEATAVVTANAAEAATGGAAAVASIPVIGPALAIAAFVALMALCLGALGMISAKGGYDIPSGVNPMVRTHAREMVLPENLADRIRNMTEPSGGKTVHFTFAPKIQAFDSKDVERALLNSRSGVNKAWKRMTRDLNLAVSYGT